MGLRMTSSVLKVVAALLADPTAQRYGLQLMEATGLPSGTLYPILVRLEAAGWVRSEWEDIDPVAEGRPSRRYYRLTAEGETDARREVAAMHQQLSRGTGSTQPGLTT
ncbi:PadR family transcriptional regulator [Actinoplanes sp. NPDC049681]|uniref:PadR family transcriptional regulator n=1 Tax=Actinoplanes sp. NPDC049681 TaxID=3363905 RepID=UPI0037B6890E